MLECLSVIPKEGSAVGLEHGARQRFGEDVRRVALGLDVLRGDDAALKDLEVFPWNERYK